jgi:hypothetical protein
VKRSVYLAALAAVLLALAAGSSGPVSASPSKNLSPGTQTCVEGTGKGPGFCNCTEMPATIMICHVDSVTVTLGAASVGSFATGQTSTTCITASAKPGTCVWVEYSFTCCKGFFGWDCTPVGFPRIQDGPAIC